MTPNPDLGVEKDHAPDAAYRSVEVEWLDSMSEGIWMPADTAISRATREAMLHRSIGYLIHETDDLILLAGSRGESSENVADTMQIPRVAILAIHSLYKQGDELDYTGPQVDAIGGP